MTISTDAPYGPCGVSNGVLTPTKMRIFLVQTAQGLTPSSGGYKANVNLLRQLRLFGHDAAQICYGFEDEVEKYAELARAKGVEPNVTHHSGLPVIDSKGNQHELDVKTFMDEHGIHNIVISRVPFNEAYPTREFWQDTQDYLEDRSITQRMQTLIDIFSKHITAYRPSHVVFNDPVTMKVTADHAMRPTFKRINVIHTAEQLPFGPYCNGILGHCSSPKVEDQLLRELEGIWVVSKAIGDYAWQHGRLKTTFLVHSPLTYLDARTGGMPVQRYNIDKFEVGMVNPCPHKGLSILLKLAKRLPQIQFVTWSSWGSRSKHLDQLKELPNMKVMPTTSNTDEIWDRIKVLLAPSVWLEAWGVVVTEAQLRGIPVIASNAGGLKEAKIDLPYCLPVNVVTGAKHENGDYIVPEQNIDLWEEAVLRLMTCQQNYDRVARATAQGSVKWLNSLDPRAHEKWFLGMMTA
ncbi:hypothetical protein QR685DRAFT_499921 [Neurospora intermedia]|uniref:Glycosyl transferase family 1 domain-containing protein n=1 Tax=Neurospora intermedia TaxID=5142 RepID=A0ABR3DAZ6_NEUIN